MGIAGSFAKVRARCRSGYRERLEFHSTPIWVASVWSLTAQVRILFSSFFFLQPRPSTSTFWGGKRLWDANRDAQGGDGAAGGRLPV